MLYENTKFSGIDLIVVLLMVMLVAAGFITIYSAVHPAESTELQANFSKQILWFSIGAFLFLGTTLLSLRLLRDAAYWIYFISCLLLILSLFSNTASDVNRWIAIGPIQFQPAEFCKISVVLALSRYLSEEKRDLKQISNIAMVCLIVFLPVILLIMQPDLGTALVFLSLILPVVFWAGLPFYFVVIFIAPVFSMMASFNYYSFFAMMIIIALVFLVLQRGTKFLFFNMTINIAIAVLTPFLWGQLHEYQKHRILTFLGIELDVHGSGYQIIQSKVAIGSGGFFGKGFLAGTQTQLKFLPAQHTDFVFSVIGEEFGFLGILFIMLMFYFIIIRGIYIASRCRNNFASLMAIGSVTVIAIHVIVNIGMTVGIMPVTGIPLPFISYGGSSLMTNMILVAFIINASLRRHNF